MGQDERRVAAELGRESGARAGDDWAFRPDEATATMPSSSAGPPAAPSASEPARAGGPGRAVREVVETLLLAVAIFLAVRLVVLNFRVDGLSMAPNLDDQQMLLVNRNAYANFDLNRLLNILPGEDREGERVVYPFDPPQRGDIVVFDPPDRSDKPYIKRVIGLPGERITFEGDRVQVNGQALDEPYIPPGVETVCAPRDDAFCRVTVPEDSVFVLGDNRDNSEDSRFFGPVEVEEVVGKAWLSYWPVDDIGVVPHYDYSAVPERPMRAGAVGTPTPTATGAPSDADPGAVRPRRADRPARTERTPNPERTREAGTAG